MEDSGKDEVIQKVKKGNTKLVIVLLAVIVILGLIIYKFLFKNSSKGIIIDAKTSFEKTSDVQELRTAKFTYNGVAKKCQDGCKYDDSDKPLYYVSYEGEVTVGLDFEEISFEVDKDKKILKIITPEVKITDARTFIEKQKFIFKKGGYDTATELSEANRICNEDIKRRASEDDKLLQTAKDNAKIVLEQFFSSWLDHYYTDYKLEVL